MLSAEKILSSFNPTIGEITGVPLVKRHWSDLRGCFADSAAFATALAMNNPLIYTVASVTPARGDGDLHYDIVLIGPGKIGNEYFMTKGHLHTWRDAAEFCLGLTGEGGMVLEDEASDESRMVKLRPSSIVYVPGRTVHRTINTGGATPTYLGVYPAKAGDDYGAIASHNFCCVVGESHRKPEMIKRQDF